MPTKPGSEKAQPGSGRAASADRSPGRPAVARLVDPLDLAGKASRTLLPNRPAPQAAHLLYYAALAGLALADVVEPPVALLLAVGHILASSRSPAVRELGAAVDDAG